MDRLIGFGRTLLKIISPPFCEYCRKFLKDRTIFCTDCLLKIKPVVSSSLKVTASFSINIYAASAYQEPLQSLILAKRWSHRLASNYLGQLIWQRSVLQSLPCDFFVPIPLHWSRSLRRGFNQSEIIANELASRHDSASVVNVLQRTKMTKYQAGLNAVERASNLKQVFCINQLVGAKDFKDKHLILVDDVVASGATVIAAAKELLKLKPASISVVAACRSV